MGPERRRSHAFIFILSLTGSAIPTLLSGSTTLGLEPAAQRALFILLSAASLWVTGALAPFAVRTLVIGLSIGLLGRPGGVFAHEAEDWEIL